MKAQITIPQNIVSECLESGWDLEEIEVLYKEFVQQLVQDVSMRSISRTFTAWLQDQNEDDLADLVRKNQQLEVGMQVEIIDGARTTNQAGDVGIITEVDNSYIFYRVQVEGRANAGNWMRASQVARINY
jgi:hypothetical protein